MGRILVRLDTWMLSYCLRLTPPKAKCIWFGTRQQLAKLNLDDLTYKFPTYAFTATVHDLGALLELTSTPHLHRF